MSGHVAVVVWPFGDDACNLLVEWLSWIQALLKWIIEESADADIGDGFAVLEVRVLELERHFFLGIGCSREFGLALILNGKLVPRFVKLETFLSDTEEYQDREIPPFPGALRRGA